MKIKEALSKFFSKYIFRTDWRCLNCGREVFNGEDFCSDCEKTLPFNNKAFCEHCGRETAVAQGFCLTCKGRLTNLDICRSAFSYRTPISKIIKNYKYDNKRYFSEVFPKYLAPLYYKYRMTADYVVCVPMTDKAKKKRGFNQSELLAKALSEKINVPFSDCLIKKQETLHQAKLGREDRLKNMKDVFKVKDKKEISGKRILIVDDVTTTGATAEAVAEKLKKAGAIYVSLLTIASVPAPHGNI